MKTPTGSQEEKKQREITESHKLHVFLNRGEIKASDALKTLPQASL